METHFENIRHAHSAQARERVLTDLKTLVRDSEDLLKVTAHDLGEQASEARVRLTAALKRTREIGDRIQQQTRAVAQKTDALVRENPYESLAAAFAVGVVIGVLASRRQ